MDVSVFFRCLLFFEYRKGSTLMRASLRCNDKGFHSLTRASYLFLIGQENVTEKKATPERRTTGILPCVFVLGSRWSLIAHPRGLTACDRDSRSTSLRGPDESCAHPARRTGSKNLKQKQRKRRPGPPKENPTSTERRLDPPQAYPSDVFQPPMIAAFMRNTGSPQPSSPQPDASPRPPQRILAPLHPQPCR